MLKDKNIVITGASSGIGKAIAYDCAKNGANLVLISRNSKNLNRLASQLEKYKIKILSIPIDVSDKKQVVLAAKKILQVFNHIDVLVNNAGIGVYGKFSEKSLEDIEKVIKTNLLGTIYMTKSILPSMMRHMQGHIVNIGSVLSKIGLRGMADYSASKFAVAGFSESLYHELKPLGISVSVVYPGYVKTNFHKNASFKNARTSSPVKGIEPEEVSSVVMKALREKRFEYFVPGFYGPLMKAKSLLPGTFRKLQQRRK